MSSLATLSYDEPTFHADNVVNKTTTSWPGSEEKWWLAWGSTTIYFQGMPPITLRASQKPSLLMTPLSLSGGTLGTMTCFVDILTSWESSAGWHTDSALSGSISNTLSNEEKKRELWTFGHCLVWGATAVANRILRTVPWHLELVTEAS